MQKLNSKKLLNRDHICQSYHAISNGLLSTGNGVGPYTEFVFAMIRV